MIKLNRSNPPAKLTEEFVKKKTELYQKTGKNVWNIGWLKESLLELSKSKCAYCECSLKMGSSYMEVEHFIDKRQAPDKVLDWENLLPSCKHCNVHKFTHDVISEPIVNPFVDDPANHLYFQHYRYKAKDAKGERTIDVLDLNGIERNMTGNRFEVGNKLQYELEACQDMLTLYRQENSVVRRNKFVGTITNIMKECLPESEYSAICATVLHSCEEYQTLKHEMKELNLWTRELDEYDKISRSICLFK